MSKIAGEAEMAGVSVVENRNQLIFRDTAFQQRRTKKYVDEAVHDTAGAVDVIGERMFGAHGMMQSRRRLERDTVSFALNQELRHLGRGRKCLAADPAGAN